MPLSTNKTPVARIMIVAGEPSGDRLAGELALELKARAAAAGRSIELFGAGGEHLRQSGADVLIDLPSHALIGIPSIGEYLKFRGFRDKLVDAARERQPDVFVGVDFFGFNGRLAASLHRLRRARGDPPRLVQLVSPQVWASRPGRARQLEASHDLLLSILPFEKEWYSKHAPGLRVEFVGHPILDRPDRLLSPPSTVESAKPSPDRVVLLPGSRKGEISRHLPVVAQAWRKIRDKHSVDGVVVAANDSIAEQIRQHPDAAHLPEIRVGGLNRELNSATVALACTGTVMLECAMARIPTVAFYKTSWLTYFIGKRIVTVKFLAMPNLLAGREVFPEFVQDAASPENLAGAVIGLLEDAGRRSRIREELAGINRTLGAGGAAARAADAVWGLVPLHSAGRTL